MSDKEWAFEISSDLCRELEDCFLQGPICDDGKRWLNEKYVGEYKGLKMEVFANEHPPPHFRVKYDGKTANFTIKDCKPLNDDLKKFRKNVEKWHAKNKQHLICEWDNMRPSDCPVGVYKE